MDANTMTVNQKEVVAKKELKKIKIRMKGLIGSERLPIELTILPKVKAIFDENAIAEVTNSQARMLLGPGHEGEGWELIKEESVKPTAPLVTKAKLGPKAPDPIPNQEVNKDFLDKVRG